VNVDIVGVLAVQDLMVKSSQLPWGRTVGLRRVDGEAADGGDAIELCVGTGSHGTAWTTSTYTINDICVASRICGTWTMNVSR